MSRVVELLCSRRVPQVAVLALMSIGFAGCSADMSTRLSQNSFSNPFASQPEATGSVPTPAVERRELPQYSASAVSTAVSVLGAAAADRGAAVLSDRAMPACPEAGAGWLPIRRPPIRSLRPPAALRRARSRRRTAGAGRHHDHRRHQRHARNSVAPLQRFVGRDHAGQRLQRAARAVARPAADHSASGRGRRRRAAALAAPASKPVAVARRAVSVHVVNHGDTLAQHRAPQSCVRWPNWPGPTISMPSAKLKLGMKLTVPGAKTAAAAPVAQPVAVAAAQPLLRSPLPPATKVAAATPIRRRSARLAQATAKIEDAPAAEAPVKASRGHRRAADIPLAGARQGDHGLRRQDQRQVQ